MGMAAGQARLLSITQRLNDNELKAQSITRAKTRLSDSMSAIGEEYIEALNRTQLKYSTYDADGNVLDEVTFSRNNALRFNKIVNDGDDLIVVGHTYKKDEEKSTDTYNYLDYRGIIVKFNTDLEKKANNKENGSGVDYFSDVIVTDDGYLVGGASSSKELGSNNKDYRTYFLKYNKDLEREFYK